MSRTGKENGNRGAFACAEQTMHQEGLTKREWVATTLLAGILANPANLCFTNEMMSDAISIADEFLGDLGKDD